MKRGKYITALILFAAATVLLALFNLDGFPQALPNTYKLVVSNPAKVDYIGLDQIARQHNLLFCGITQQNTGLQKRTVTFYTGADQQDALWQEHLGLEPGSVSPFGLINDAEQHVILFLDSRLRKADLLSFHPNDCRGTVVIRRADFERYLSLIGNQYEYINLY